LVAELKPLLARPLLALKATLDGAKVLPAYIEALMIAGFRLVGEEAATRPAYLTAQPALAEDRLWETSHGVIGGQSPVVRTWWQGRVRHRDGSTGQDLTGHVTDSQAVEGDCSTTYIGVQEADLAGRGAAFAAFDVSEPVEASYVIEVYDRGPVPLRFTEHCKALTEYGNTITQTRTSPPAGIHIGDELVAYVLQSTLGEQEYRVLGAQWGRVVLTVGAVSMSEAVWRLEALARHIDETLGTRFVPDGTEHGVMTKAGRISTVQAAGRNGALSWRPLNGR
jgi:hypothetical protein